MVAAAQGRLVVKAAGKQGNIFFDRDCTWQRAMMMIKLYYLWCGMILLLLFVPYRTASTMKKKLKMMATDCSYLYDDDDDEREMMAGVQQDQTSCYHSTFVYTLLEK